MKELELYLDRAWKKDTYTIGKLFIEDQRFSETCEDKDRGLSKDMPLKEIKAKKIYGKTAIPTGRYEIKMTYSPKFANRAWAKKFGGKVLEIVNVPGYSGVRIHPFNTAEESLGCIAPGRNTVKGKVTSSTVYYNKLTSIVVPEMEKGRRVFITIK